MALYRLKLGDLLSIVTAFSPLRAIAIEVAVEPALSSASAFLNLEERPFGLAEGRRGAIDWKEGSFMARCFTGVPYRDGLNLDDVLLNIEVGEFVGLPLL